ncbi:MAG: HD domain-containing protein [Candidatus Obscuribacterales bacterium]|nr:HD domain-containing protein [Candidatus Obscuribacterales bacterium]
MHRTDKRTYLDPIHQDIVLDRKDPAEKLIIDLIDTEEFQRLRRIHQLGVSYFTFQGAEGSRFTHSVGVMHVASHLVDALKEITPGMAEKRPLILASALLHDIGHGPFSHVTEKILGYDHEDWSCRIIAGDTGVRKVLDSFQEMPGLADTIVKVLKKTYKPKYVSHIVSSQLDCDRFDYLLRDSYMTGTKYGLFALHRILRSLEIDEDNDRILVVGEKGQIAVEDYLFARYSMYAQVYYHRKNLSARALLANLIKRVKQILADSSRPVCFADEATSKWFLGANLAVNEYLQLDDIQLMYHIKRWADDPDPILADLSSRFLHRRLFKAIRIPSEDSGLVRDIEKEARRLVKEKGLDPDYYTGIESTGFRPYDYYRPSDEHPQTNIMVRTEGGITSELSKVSLAIEALVKGNYESTWLVFPDEIQDKIAVIKELIPVH